MNAQKTLTCFLISICLGPVAGSFSRLQAQSESAGPWDREGILANAKSPQTRWHSIPVRAVTLGPGFWTSRRDINRLKSLPSMFNLLEEHGVIDNFRRLSGRKQVERKGPLYTDSDLYKWMEAVAWTLHQDNDPALRALLDRMIGEVSAAQGKDGYLNTYYALERANERFTNFRHGHELYCLGHLLQAGLAEYRGSGNRRLLEVGIRYADYVTGTLGPGKKPAMTGHPELDMALVELYRSTGERRYLDFAGYLLNTERPELKLSPDDISYLFSGIPFMSRQRFEGHSVRAMYASCGAADFYSESGDAQIKGALDRLWQDLISSKMYITGGVGSRESGESIGEPYELPNEQAYTETCAAIGNFMWSWRMSMVTGEARFADVCERALYNGVLSGVSLSGDLYFYRNPLSSLGHTVRQPWYSTTCCPPNIQRTLASLPGYFYSTSREGLWVHLYHDSELDWRLEDGQKIRLAQQTRYPWDNVVDFTVKSDSTTPYGLFFRIPGWCQSARVRVNGDEFQTLDDSGNYHELRRAWKTGDRVRLEFQMPVQLMEANPRVREDFGRVAFMRGPLVYCLEGIDTGNISPFDLTVLVDKSGHRGFATEFHPELLGGVTVIRARVLAAAKPSVRASLYQPLGQEVAATGTPFNVTLIPYYAWANRGAAEMEVWLPWKRE